MSLLLFSFFSFLGRGRPTSGLGRDVLGYDPIEENKRCLKGALFSVLYAPHAEILTIMLIGVVPRPPLPRRAPSYPSTV